MGLREPLNDWTTDRTGLCMTCAEKSVGTVNFPPPENPPVANQDAEPKDEIDGNG
jgi:hypothetical protein